MLPGGRPDPDAARVPQALYAEALREAEIARTRADTLARAGTALTSSMRVERVLAELVRVVVPALADVCTVHLARGNAAIVPIAAAADAAREETAHALAERQAADAGAQVGPAAVIRTGRREVVASLTAEELIEGGVHPEERRLLAELGVRSAAVLPLRARGAVLGSLTLMMGASGRSYDDVALVELAESIAAGAGLALDNARLFAEQVEVARALQRTLLPSELPYVPGVELAARYRAAGRSNQAGGDFYDVFAAGEGEWALVIGDVVGKGAEAAAITALVRATLQAAVLHGDDAESALHLVDEALRRRPQIQFCSAIHGRVRPQPGGDVEVQLLTGGHPPPLIRRGDGEVEALELTGTLLGVTPDPQFGEATVRLRPGDALLLYTDGAIELRGGHPWRGEQALRDTLGAAVDGRLGELVERVEHNALVLSGGELRDDLALLAVCAAPPDGQ